MRRTGMVRIVLLITALVSLIPVGNAQADDYFDWINYTTLNELKPVILGLQNSINALQSTVNNLQNTVNSIVTNGVSTTPRLFYLTKETHQGNTALSACAQGFHMASLW